jgi:hypothetical protein
LSGQGADPAQDAVHQHELAVHRTVGEHGAVGGDARDAQGCAELVAEVVGQRDGQACGYDGVLGGRAEGPV